MDLGELSVYRWDWERKGERGLPAGFEAGGCHGGELGRYGEDAVEFAVGEGGGNGCCGAGENSRIG